MKIEQNCIIPFDEDNMAFQCQYDEKGHLIGLGKILDIYGKPLCEGEFIVAPNVEKKSISILKSGFFYFDDKKYEISNFDGQNGYGAIIRAYTAIFPCFDLKAGHFKNGELDGLGIDVDNVATFTKGEFHNGKLSKGSRSSSRGSKTECYEEYSSFDHDTHIAKGKIEYRGEGEIIEGEIELSAFRISAKGVLRSTKSEDKWEGEFYWDNGKWAFVNGKGKWKGFEGEAIDGKLIKS